MDMFGQVPLHDHLRANAEAFRDTMESIFQKYSNLNDPGVDVCLKTMTCRTAKGSIPLNTEEADLQLESLRTRMKAEQSISVSTLPITDLNDSEDNQMEVTQNVDEDEVLCETTRLDGSSVDEASLFPCDSKSVLQEVPSEDEELERTLSSHGSTLLEVYPSMLKQIRAAYRRQCVYEAASAVLRRYRRHRLHATRLANASRLHAKHLANANRGHATHTNSLHAARLAKAAHANRLHATRSANAIRVECHSNWSQSTSRTTSKLSNSTSTWSPDCKGMASLSRSNLSSLEAPPSRGRLASSPRVRSLGFYSPVRTHADEITEADNRRFRSEEPEVQRPVLVMDFSTPPSSPSCSPDSLHQDFNQTYNVTTVPSPRQPTAHPRSGIPSPRHVGVKLSSFIGQKGSLILSPTRHHRHSKAIQPMDTSLDKEWHNHRLHSPSPSPTGVLIGSASPGGRSPVRQRVMSCNVERPSSMPSPCSAPNHASPARLFSRSLVPKPTPVLDHQGALPSPRYKASQHYQRNYQKWGGETWHQPEVGAARWQRSFSGPHPSPSSSSTFKSQVDADFRKLYHHFVCPGTFSPCHMCERPVEEPIRGHASSPSPCLSALALTPLRGRLQKRPRQPSPEDSMHLKRFREGRLPSSPQQWRHPLVEKDITSLTEASDDHHTTSRAFLLQCPSPRFLQAGRTIRSVPGSRPRRLDRQHSSCRQGDLQQRGPVAAAPSPMSARNGSAVSPSASRRRLLYNLLQ